MAATSSILASVHAVETALLQICDNPLCTVQFREWVQDRAAALLLAEMPPEG